MLLNEGNLSSEESNYGDTAEGDQLIVESFIIDTGLENFSEEEILSLVDCGLLSEKSVVRLDKYAHRNRAMKKTAIIIAKERRDPMFIKLQKAYMMKKRCIAAIMKKYGNQANSRVRKNHYTNNGLAVDKASVGAKAIAKISKSIVTASTQLKSTDIAGNKMGKNNK